MGKLFLLYESDTGYYLFRCKKSIFTFCGDQESTKRFVADPQMFTKCVIQIAEIHSVSGVVRQYSSMATELVVEELAEFLKGIFLPLVEEFKITLGVSDLFMWNIDLKLKFNLRIDALVTELLRGVQLHFHLYEFEGFEAHLETQFGDKHVSTILNHIRDGDENFNKHASTLLKSIDGELEVTYEILRKVYSAHFPELQFIVKDMELYARASLLILDRSVLSPDKVEGLMALFEDKMKVEEIIFASKVSVGKKIPKSIESSTSGSSFSLRKMLFCEHCGLRLRCLFDQKKAFSRYLDSK